MRDSSAFESLAEKEASARSRLEAAAESHRESVLTLRDAISRKDKLIEELRKVIMIWLEIWSVDLKIMNVENELSFHHFKAIEWLKDYILRGGGAVFAKLPRGIKIQY